MSICAEIIGARTGRVGTALARRLRDRSTSELRASRADAPRWRRASSGLGLATAKALADGGRAPSPSAAASRERIDAAAAEIGPLAVPLVADVSHRSGRDRVRAGGARDALGGVDILVCNGGGPPPGNFTQHRRPTRTGPRSSSTASPTSRCAAPRCPRMREQRWGRVLAITSIGVRQPIAGLILSNVARSGLTAFLKTLARESRATASP